MTGLIVCAVYVGLVFVWFAVALWLDLRRQEREARLRDELEALWEMPACEPRRVV